MKKLSVWRGIILLLLAAALLLSVPAFALNVVEPTSQFYVADYADVIDSDTEDYIVQKNAALASQTGAQIVVVTVDYIGSAGIEDYAYTLFNDWGIGSKEKNNGVLLLLVTGAEDYWCMQGSGIERSLTSGMLSDILYDYLEEDFAQGDYDSGVRKCFDALYEAVEDIYGDVDESGAGTIIGGSPATGSGGGASGSTYYYEEPSAFQRVGSAIKSVFTVILVLAVILIVVIALAAISGGGRRSRGPYYGPGGPGGPGYGGGMGPWGMFFLGSLMGSSRRRGPYDRDRHDHHDRGPRGPRGGGGFGGFGGGGGFGGSGRGGGGFGGGGCGGGGGGSRGGGAGRGR